MMVLEDFLNVAGYSPQFAGLDVADNKAVGGLIDFVDAYFGLSDCLESR
jgi:hypothetical protein